MSSVIVKNHWVTLLVDIPGVSPSHKRKKFDVKEKLKCTWTNFFKRAAT